MHMLTPYMPYPHCVLILETREQNINTHEEYFLGIQGESKGCSTIRWEALPGGQVSNILKEGYIRWESGAE